MLDIARKTVGHGREREVGELKEEVKGIRRGERRKYLP